MAQVGPVDAPARGYPNPQKASHGAGGYNLAHKVRERRERLVHRLQNHDVTLFYERNTKI